MATVSKAHQRKELAKELGYLTIMGILVVLVGKMAFSVWAACYQIVLMSV